MDFRIFYGDEYPKEVTAMKRLTELSNLFLVGIAVATVFALAPVKTTSAGSYVWDHWEYYDSDEDFYDSGDNWLEAGSADSYAWYDYATCSASANTEARINNLVGSFSAGVSMNGWGSGGVYWQWQGPGTPTGGTLSYSYTVSGSASANGSTSADPNSTASAGSSGSSSGSAGESGSGSASGGVSDNNWGNTSASVSPSEAGETSETPDYGSYSASCNWSLDDSDYEEYPVGTTYVSFSVSANCDADSTSGASASELGRSAEGSSGGSSSATASGSGTFP